MRAVIHTVHARTRGPQLPFHLSMHFVYQRLREVPPSDAGLIGDNDYGQSRVVQPPHRRRRERKHPKPVDSIQISPFLGDGSVAVQKTRRAKAPRVMHAASRLRAATVASPIPPLAL